MISQQTQSEAITLTVTNKVGSTHECQLLPNEGIFVGKSSNCRLQLSGDGLSDIHCRIELDQRQGIGSGLDVRRRHAGEWRNHHKQSRAGSWRRHSDRSVSNSLCN